MVPAFFACWACLPIWPVFAFFCLSGLCPFFAFCFWDGGAKGGGHLVPMAAGLLLVCPGALYDTRGGAPLLYVGCFLALWGCMGASECRHTHGGALLFSGWMDGPLFLSLLVS